MLDGVETEYISKEIAVKGFKTISEMADTFSSAVKNIEKAFNNAMTEDVVEVVRCKDCKHRLYSLDCSMFSDGFKTHDDWYCAYGERIK